MATVTNIRFKFLLSDGIRNGGHERIYRSDHMDAAKIAAAGQIKGRVVPATRERLKRRPEPIAGENNYGPTGPGESDPEGDLAAMRPGSVLKLGETSGDERSEFPN